MVSIFGCHAVTDFFFFKFSTSLHGDIFYVGLQSVIFISLDVHDYCTFYLYYVSNGMQSYMYKWDIWSAKLQM